MNSQRSPVSRGFRGFAPDTTNGNPSNFLSCFARQEAMAKEFIDDELWSLIEPLLPAREPRNRRYAGRKPTPDRAILAGIVFVLRSGIAWNLLPQEMGCGSGTACWRRLVAWQKAGVWQRMHETLLAELRRRGQLDMARAIVDSSSIRAMAAGKKQAPIRRTGASSAASTTSSSTRKASLSRSS